MTTKKRPAKVEATDTPAYGTKSEPPRNAIKEMLSKQSESSSKDPLHKTALKFAPKLKKAK